MSRWSSVLPGRGRRSGSGSGSGTGRRGAPGPDGGASGAVNRGAGGPPVEDVDGVLLVRSVEDDSFPLDVVAEVAGAVGEEEDVVTVIVGSGGAAPGADHWARLGALLDSLRDRGTEKVRLVMSGAGDDRPDRPSVARRIADAWELEVTAPDGAVLITPGGTLFAHGDSGAGSAWWRFAPGAQPRRLGRRAPAPAWEEALDGVPARTGGGCVVDRIPAGVVIRPAEAPGPAPDDLCFSVPVDFERLTVLVGAPHAEDVAADEVAAVLEGLPAAERARVRLAPGGRRDLLRLGQSVADLTGAEVEVLTGLPLLDDHAPAGTPPRPTLVGREGAPTWRPFVSSVVCGPVDADGRAPVPRPVGFHPPDWILGGSEPGTVRLTDRWQATVTRAGLALWAPDGPRPGPVGLAVDPEVCAIELGMPGQPLDGSLLPALAQLLRGLGTDVRSRTTLLVRGRLPAGDGALRRLAAEQGIPGIRYVTAVRPSHAGPATGRRGTAAAGGAVPSTAVSGTAVESGAGVPAVAGSGAPAPTRPERPHGGRAATASGPGRPVREVGATAAAGAGDPAVAGSRTSAPAPAVASGPGRPVRVSSGTGSVPVGGAAEERGGGRAVSSEAPEDPGAAGPAAPSGVGGAAPAGAGSDVPGEAAGAAVRGETKSGVSSTERPSENLATPDAPEREGSDPVVKARVAGRDGGGSAGGRVPDASGPEGFEPAGQVRAVSSGRAAAEPRPQGGPAPDADPSEGSRPAMKDSSVGERGEPGSDGRRARDAGDAKGSAPVVRARGAAEPERGRALAADKPEGSGRVAGERGGPGRDGGRASDAGAAEGPGPVPRAPGAAEPEGGPAPGAGAVVKGRGGVGAVRVDLPFVPGHVSGAAERAAFREAAGGDWEGHAAAVSRMLTRMPALRGHELDAARTDLIAAHAYLTADEGPLHHRELIRDLHTGEGRLLPYGGCLASALRRLPSYRGVALRGGDAGAPEPAVGTLLHDPAPVSALATTSALPAGAPVRYAIWSVTGRKVRQLLDRPGGSPETYEEIVFVPGTGFRVLGVRTVPTGPSVVLLRELPGNATAYMDGSEELSGLDLKARTHLEEALAKGFRAGDGTRWPERCSGPVGQDG
ncbi:hypothetical protein [Streptomyces sp. NRRL WC-3626]|uniref:hypothetical protein n=1 Tax=Streptomyces sp. NRRL WC-3626 TaxID=1463926 RepID=UPI000AFFB712|nr:hypothetical protein [Streptomyces sp. NRRL WC-3626]